MIIYSYMEFSTAGPRSPWHIRRLTGVGKKLGGGIDTPSLCGREFSGWDLDVEVGEFHNRHVCDVCVRQYEKETRKPR